MSIAAYVKKLATATDPAAMKRIGSAAGFAAKDAALAAAAKDLGGDRAMSGLKKGKSPLRAGWRSSGPSEVTIRHTGPWRLADEGRKTSGMIYPRDKNRKASRRGTARQLRTGRAVLTPWGPRAASRYGPSKGLDTLKEAVEAERKVVPPAAAKAVQAEIARVLRG